MGFQPPHPESLAGLHRLQHEAKQRGDEYLAMLLAGIDLYISVGREWELLEIMRRVASETTIILVTHHLSDIIPEIERVVLLRQGKVFRDGQKPDVLTNGVLSA